MMFCDWRERVMSVLGTTKHSYCNNCIDTWQGSCNVYCINGVSSANVLTLGKEVVYCINGEVTLFSIDYSGLIVERQFDVSFTP